MADYVCEVRANNLNGQDAKDWIVIVNADSHQQAAERVTLGAFDRNAKVVVREIKPEKGRGFWVEKRAVVTTEVVLVD